MEAGDSPVPLSSPEPPAGVLHQLCDPLAEERQESVTAGPERPTEIIRGLNHVSHEERLRELCLFGQGKAGSEETL